MIEYALIFIGSLFLWLPIYYYMVSRWVGDHVVRRVENKEIDLNYLLDEGGVFDSMAGRTVEQLKNHMLAGTGNLAKVLSNPDGDPELMAVKAGEGLLKDLGLKSPSALMIFKLLQSVSAPVAVNEGVTNDFRPVVVGADILSR